LLVSTEYLVWPLYFDMPERLSPPEICNVLPKQKEKDTFLQRYGKLADEQ